MKGGVEGETGTKVGGNSTDLCTFVHTTLYEVQHPLFSLWGYERSQVCPCLHALVNFELLSTIHDLWDPVPCLPHEHCRGERHAALACSTKGSTHQLIDGVLLIGIRHDHTVVLSTLQGGGGGGGRKREEEEGLSTLQGGMRGGA